MINREQIIHAAVGAVRAGGYERMTIPSLAADLGVSPMAVYHHVRDKVDLLDEIVDRLLAQAWRPKADPANDWRAWLTEGADKLRHLLVTHPVALEVYLTHPVASPAAIARMNAIIDILRRALGDEQIAQRAYAALHSYTIGFAALEASRSRRKPRENIQHSIRSSGRVETNSNDDRQPDNSDLVNRLAAYTTGRQFRQGLSYLLDGIEREAAATSNH
jgi:TetR/AcrR family tetracycline transcriptional repressor